MTQPVAPGIQPYQLTDETAVITLNGSGNGQVSVTPGAPSPGGGVGTGRNSGLSWDVVGVAVSAQPVSPATVVVNDAQCSVYLSYGILDVSPSSFQGQTPTGSTGDTDTLTANVRPGDWITAVWTGGDPGALATMRILGTVNPPGVS